MSVYISTRKVAEAEVSLENTPRILLCEIAMASRTTAQLQERLQAASAEFQKIQSDISNVLEIRQRLDAQQSENELVKKVCDSQHSKPSPRRLTISIEGILDSDTDQYDLQAHRASPRTTGAIRGEE